METAGKKYTRLNEAIENFQNYNSTKPVENLRVDEIMLDEEIAKKCDFENFTCKKAVKLMKETGELVM